MKDDAPYKIVTNGEEYRIKKRMKKWFGKDKHYWIFYIDMDLPCHAVWETNHRHKADEKLQRLLLEHSGELYKWREVE